MTNRKLLFIVALLILSLSAILFVVSYFIQPLLPAPWNNALVLGGVVVGGVLAALSGFNDGIQLIDRLLGRGGKDETKNGGASQIGNVKGVLVTSDSSIGDVNGVRVTGDNSIGDVNGVLVTGDSSIGDINGVLVTGNNNSVTYLIEQAGEKRDNVDLRKAVDDYLHWLVEQYGILQLRGIEIQGKQVISLPLERVYVPLAAETDTRAETETIALDKLLAHGRRLILIGGPGSGKTTVLMHLAWALAQAIAQDKATLAQERVGFPAQDPLPLPIFIPLSAYATYLYGHPKPSDPTLIAYITSYLYDRQVSPKLPKDFFRCLMNNDQAVLLLLDGLDEVANEDQRAVVRQKIEDLATTGRDKLRIVVTCRPAAYRGRTALGHGFREVRVLPLAQEHITNLVSQAYASIYAHDPRKRQDKTTELLEGIAKLEDQRRQRLGKGAQQLIDSPLLVRMLLIVHVRERRLPEQRAELYMKATDAMLLPDYAPDEKVANELGARIGGSKEKHRDLAQHLAFQMHNRGEGQGRQISEDVLGQLLAQEAEYAALVKDFIALTRQRGTLLEEQSGTYRFIHLAFQEYLAARYLAEITRSKKGIEGMAGFLEAGPVLDSWWREVILLTVGYLNTTSLQVGRLFWERLTGVDEDRGTRRPASPDVQLAMAELGFVAWQEWRTTWPTLETRLLSRLVSLFQNRGVMSKAKAQYRVAVGRAIEQLGDPRPEIMDVDRMPFCFVPAGPFYMGSDEVKYDDEGPLRQLTLGDYWIGQYPVSQAQFAQFMTEGGYATAGYWAEAKERGYWQPGRFKGRWDSAFRTGPRQYGEPFDLANHPIVGVSWYESLAFGRWLTERWRAAGWLPEGWQIRLPSEAQWEKAARGGLEMGSEPVIKAPAGLTQLPSLARRPNPNPQRRFPWGHSRELDRFRPGLANSKEATIGTTSPIGAFPLSDFPYGAVEMAGNVWEWCQTKWKGEPYQLDPGREKIDASDAIRSVRGGGWYNEEVRLRCAYRNGFDPFRRNLNFGFRLVASPS